MIVHADVVATARAGAQIPPAANTPAIMNQESSANVWQAIGCHVASSSAESEAARAAAEAAVAQLQAGLALCEAEMADARAAIAHTISAEEVPHSPGPLILLCV